MPRYNIEWSGTITRDIGWADIEADSPEDAERKYLREHPMRRVRSVILDDSAASEPQPTDEKE